MYDVIILNILLILLLRNISYDFINHFFFYFQTFVCVPDTRYLQTVDSFNNFYATIECQQPITDLYKFVGRIVIDKNRNELVTRPLTAENVLLRGARLKNTPFVFGKFSNSMTCLKKYSKMFISYCIFSILSLDFDVNLKIMAGGYL